MTIHLINAKCFFKVGINCGFDHHVCLEVMKRMKLALEKENLKVFLIAQSNGFFTTGINKGGYFECPEFPFGIVDT